ncbi:hypothetical protein F0562_034188 [Nyssa sinensis]|uniref:Uncharacterized protein n=1 Tax=Nyssa sinensis TaxID=561372 RepID=A0A5J5AIK2_9ASTE|nr:hypothetical protein F0562_034188 [Nyssa sinensis]
MPTETAVEVEVITIETIKPSSPTTHHLRNYQLSFLDQISPPVFMPLVLFYPLDHGETKLSNVDKSNQLKTSLAEALTRFYPLAGRVIGNLSINCNDDGVPFIEARANCQLSEVLCNPIPGELNKFIPYELDDVRDLLMVIQVTFFDCGGMAVSLGISHKVADALSFFMFLNSWAATARGDTHLPCPRFESATLFPPVNLTDFKPSTGIVKEKIMTKRFVFTASKISAIRDKYSANTNADYPRRPTRIEALSAFIWSRFMASTQAKLSDSNKIYTVLHAVNLRTRIDPPLPEYYFGNVSRLAIAVPSVDSADKEDCYGIVKNMRDEIRKVNGDYVKELRQGDKHLTFIKNRAESFTKGEIISFSFTSLCRFPLYEADFGWGKPVWVGSASLKFKNLVVFMDTPMGDEIEAWVNLMGEDMAKFEVDKELVAFVSPTPGPRICGF